MMRRSWEAVFISVVSGCALLAGCSVEEGDPEASGGDGGTNLLDFGGDETEETEAMAEETAEDSGAGSETQETETETAMTDEPEAEPEGPQTPVLDQSGPFSVFDMGAITLSDEGVEVRVHVAEGTQSFAVVVDGSAQPDDLMLAERVTSPSGEIFFDFEDDISINRTDATFGFYTLLVPTNTDVVVEPGEWVVRLRSGSETFEAGVTIVTKNAPASERLMDLNLYFVGLEGLTAEEAAADEGFTEIINAVGDIYAGVGINLGEVTYNAIEGEDAETYGIIDSEAELGEMFALAPQESSQALNLFFLNDIAMGDAGLSTLGLAGGVPGPPTLQGTTRSGVAVNMGSFLAARTEGEAEMLTAASEELEIIIAHESGHFLGLFHTVERNGLALVDDIIGQDPLSDTPLCPDSADADGDMRLAPSECEGQGADNLMFWSPPNDARTLTAQQGQIMEGNPIVR